MKSETVGWSIGQLNAAVLCLASDSSRFMTKIFILS
jgi:hypothetical protein